MGQKSDEALVLTYDELIHYLRVNHSIYMTVDGVTYYLTDVNDGYWRAQDTRKFNEKKHYVDCSELVPTLSEFLGLPFIEGRTIEQAFDSATFYASEKHLSDL